MNNFSIKTKTHLISVIPLVIASILVSSLFIWEHTKDISESLNKRGQETADLLAPACEYGIFSGNHSTLRTLAYTAANDPEIASISILDADRQQLVTSNLAPNKNRDDNEKLRTFTSPVYLSQVVVDDFSNSTDQHVQDGNNKQNSVVGYVNVTMTNKHAAARQQQLLINGILITIILILSTSFLASYLSRGIINPIYKLISAIKKIQHGNLTGPVNINATGELAILATVLNDMNSSLNEMRENERQINEDKLFIEKTKAQITLESIGEGVITTDCEGKISYINPTAERLTGWSYALAQGKYLNEVFIIRSSTTNAPIKYPLETCVHHGATVKHDALLILLRSDGKEYIIQDTASPIKDRQNETIGMVLVFHDVSKIQNMSDQLAYQASHDDLTGLINRREFESCLKKALTSVQQSDSCHALCYIDLDQFKVINDTYGHQAGDELLRQLSSHLKEQIRKGDVFARLGGDEFGVILTDCPMDKAREIANSIKTAVQSYQYNWHGHNFTTGASIGLVPITDNNDSLNELLMKADSACYIAKDKGRNRVHIYQPNDEDIIKRAGDMQWLQTIQQSIENNHFVLYSQPIQPICPDTDLPVHNEILVRMKDENNNIVLPDEFIPATERYQLMGNIDRWVISNTFTTLSSYNQDNSLLFNINLSAQSICDNNFLDYLIEQFDEHDISPKSITFEITETAVMSNMSRAITFIDTLKDMGCTFALDDFGSGLSSFGYLSSLPVDYIKIDGYFSSELVNNPVNYSIIESINHIGHVMGLKTIAESVENEAILNELKACGVDYVQGFGIKKPQPLATVFNAATTNNIAQFPKS